MAKNKAKIDIESDASGASKEIKRLGKIINDLIRKNKNLGEASKKSSKESANELGKLALKYISVAKAIELGTQALKSNILEASKQRRIQDESNRSLDQQRFRTATQLGVDREGAAFAGIEKQISSLAKKSSMSINQVSAGFEAISSGGASTKMIQGGIFAESILSGLATLGSNDLSGDAKAMVLFLENSGLGKTPEGVAKAFDFAAEAKQTGKFEIGDLPQLGKYISSAVAAGQPFNQIFSMFNTLVDKYGEGSVAGTGFKVIVSKLQASSGAKKEAAFKRLGIDRKKVNLFGKGDDLTNAVEEFAAAQKRNPETFSEDVTAILDIRGAAAMKNLISESGLKKFRKGLSSTSAGRKMMTVGQINLERPSDTKTKNITEIDRQESLKRDPREISLEDRNFADDTFLETKRRQNVLNWMQVKAFQAARLLNQDVFRNRGREAFEPDNIMNNFDLSNTANSINDKLGFFGSFNSLFIPNLPPNFDERRRQVQINLENDSHNNERLNKLLRLRQQQLKNDTIRTDSIKINQGDTNITDNDELNNN